MKGRKGFLCGLGSALSGVLLCKNAQTLTSFGIMLPKDVSNLLRQNPNKIDVNFEEATIMSTTELGP